jgi:hypothetical protein
MSEPTAEPQQGDIISPVPQMAGAAPAHAPGIDVRAGFHARLGSAMGAMTAGGMTNVDQEYAQEIRIVPVSLQAPVVGGLVLFSNTELGPKTGYVWAIQYVSLAGLLAADGTSTPPATLGFYIGQPQPQNQRGQLTFAAPVINPGRTDFVLNYGDFVTVQTIPGFPLTGAETVLTLNMQVAVMQTRLLPSFLM